ncbi:MAG TPA: HlyD family efflux transporter periplasmic adaptor subunit [Flavisolibacter sp.]|nr:HlyD family efflux transporter periplasmic adaptor subunit [Flavisolibacter sp.]
MKYLVPAYLVLLFYSCKNKPETTFPVLQNITESVYAPGIIKSKDQYQVFSSVNGIIRRINVTEGSIVKKGDVLITIDNETSRLSTENAQLAAHYASIASNRDKLSELEANISLAKTKMQLDSTLLDRQQNLWSQDIGSRNELEQRQLALKNSKTNYNSTLLRYSQLKKQIDFAALQSKKNLELSSSIYDDYNVRAHKDGKVYTIFKEPGEMVSIQTPVAIIGDANDFLMELQVDEYDISRVRLGQKVMVGMDSYKGQVYEAIVSKIDPIMNDRTRSFKVEASFIHQPPGLYPNLTVEGNIIISSKEKALIVPADYLVNAEYVVLSNGEKRKVVIGLKDYQKAEILKGLTTHDAIRKPVK